MRALGRDGWLLCRWPLEESIHAESDADDSSSLGAFDRARQQFPADSRSQRKDYERTKEETKARRCVVPCGTVLRLIGFRHCFGRAVHAKSRRSIS